LSTNIIFYLFSYNILTLLWLLWLLRFISS